MAAHKTKWVQAHHNTAALSKMSYLDGALHLEGVNIQAIAATIPTPFYCYSANLIRESYQALSSALAVPNIAVCFAVKANSNLSILHILADAGCGMDIVSGGELTRALKAGVQANKIVFSGVGKKRNEIRQALEAGVHQINVESPAELDVIAETARALGIIAPVVLRVNPDVDACTHAKITTGTKGDKFGIAIEDIPELYARAAGLPEIYIAGLAMHIGSQILNLSPYRKAYTLLADLVALLRARDLKVDRLDLGGGLGIPYTHGNDQETAGPDLNEYAAIISETLGHTGCALTVEPGRWLVGRAGLLVAELLYLKQASDTSIAIIDAGMNDLMRPALYDAVHPVIPVQQPNTRQKQAYQIVGPVCESSDIFGNYNNMPNLEAGDLIAFTCVGAYCASMASTYNARDLIAEVLVDGNYFRTIRRRQELTELLALEEETQWQLSENADTVTTKTINKQAR